MFPNYNYFCPAVAGGGTNSEGVNILLNSKAYAERPDKNSIDFNGLTID